MKYFKSPSGEVYAYESDGSQDAWIRPDLVPMTPEEVEAHLSPPPMIVVPDEITNAQGHAILIMKGVYQSVLDYIAAIADPQQKLLAEVAFNRTQTWRRDSPFLIQAAADLGFLENLDDWFVEGAQIAL